jgi:argininosuccinate lyase
MPQKRNPCGMELVRARTATVIAEHARVANIVKGLPTGYNRDGQETKEPFMSGLETTRASVEIMAATVARLEVHEEKLLAGFHPEVFATDRALELVASGAPFRDAYREVKENLAALSSVDPREAVARKTHAGATANPRFEVAESALAAFERSTEAEVSKARERFESLMGLEGPAALGDAGEPSGH